MAKKTSVKGSKTARLRGKKNPPSNSMTKVPAKKRPTRPSQYDPHASQ